MRPPHIIIDEGLQPPILVVPLGPRFKCFDFVSRRETFQNAILELDLPRELPYGIEHLLALALELGTEVRDLALGFGHLADEFLELPGFLFDLLFYRAELFFGLGLLGLLLAPAWESHVLRLLDGVEVDVRAGARISFAILLSASCLRVSSCLALRSSASCVAALSRSWPARERRRRDTAAALPHEV